MYEQMLEESSTLQGDNLFDAIRFAHLFSPKIDYTALFVCISCVTIIAALVMLWYAFWIKSYRKDANGEKKKSFWRIGVKVLLLLTAVTMIFFASYSKRRITIRCGSCGVDYSFMETRFFGKLLKLDGFRTWANPEELYNGRYIKSTDSLCLHGFGKEHSIKYWGGIFPVEEFMDFFIEGATAPLSAYELDDQGNPIQKKPPTPITREMKFTNIEREDGSMKPIIVWPPKEENDETRETSP